MNRPIRTAAKKLIRKLGWDLHRFIPSSDASAQLQAVLNHIQADIVFDVGANVGQFARDLRTGGFTGKIVSFDPLKTAHTQLSLSASSDPLWSVHQRVAIGDLDGEIEINVAENSVSSSVLPILEAHTHVDVSSAYVASEKVPSVRLDTVAMQYIDSKSTLFVKIDVQGFEWQVLDGAVKTIDQAKGVLLELSLVPLYSGQRLWTETIERMTENGFTLWAIQKGFTDHRSGRSLQIDAVFLRD